MNHCCDHDHENPASVYAGAGFPLLIKALPPNDGIWREHESVYLTQIVEDFTNRGLTRLADLFDQLNKLIAERRGRVKLPNPDPKLPRWGAAQIDAIREYLEAKPVETFSIQDWQLAVDFLVQRYLPANSAKTEAAWLAQRAVLMGKVAANLEGITERQASRIVEAVPELIGGLNPVQRAVMDFGEARVADLIVDLSDRARHRIKRTILDHQRSVFLGDRAGGDLKTKLQDELGELNRDWRRIAITEATDMQGQGIVASAPIGSKVKRIEQYADACPFCKKIHGMVFTVVSPDKQDKDSWTEQWVGLSNLGRSGSPNKRTAEGLVPRTPEELWQPVPGAVHPNCRGRMVLLEGSGDDEFAAKLRMILRDMK